MKKAKVNNIIYWVATIWLALGMVSTGIAQIIQIPAEIEMMTHLGYPLYMIPLLGTWKILGVIAVLVPKFLVLKEWAYAGFFFTMSGAIISHLSAGDPIVATLPALLLLVLTMVSWYFRPANRKLISVHN